MPIVVTIRGRACLTDQRYYDATRSRSSFFLIPLDNPRPNS
jgi:hypothetical protein